MGLGICSKVYSYLAAHNILSFYGNSLHLCRTLCWAALFISDAV